MGKKVVKMRVVDWHTDDTEENFYAEGFVKLLSTKYDIEYSEKPDFLIYGPYYHSGKAEYIHYNCTRIFYTGENVRTDFHVADYGIGFDFLEFEDRYLRRPLLGGVDYEAFAKRHELLPQKTKFCGIVVSHSGPTTFMRERFCELLSSRYKQVCSGGKWNNNIGAPVQDKIKWLKNYKFNLCFENSSYPGYLTEKLFEAFRAGCIPIYWGDTSLRLPHKDEYKSYFANTRMRADFNGGGG